MRPLLLGITLLIVACCLTALAIFTESPTPLTVLTHTLSVLPEDPFSLHPFRTSRTVPSISTSTHSVAPTSIAPSPSLPFPSVTTALTFRSSCPYVVGYTSGDDISECSRVNDDDESIAARKAGRVLQRPMEDFGGLFFVHLVQYLDGGQVDVWHDNCRPERVALTSSEPNVQRYVEESFGPSALQLFIVGPELHAPFLYHVLPYNDTIDEFASHPCHYRLRYLVHETGLYQLHLEWMYSDYHFFLEDQPFWPRGLYGQLLGPVTLAPQLITATPIVLQIPVPSAEWMRELQPVRELDGHGNRTMLLPDSFPRLDPRFGDHRHFRQPQGHGRWCLRSHPPTGHSGPANASNMFWRWRSFRQDLSELHGRGITDLHEVLAPLPDCFFADIDDYEFVPYVHSMWLQDIFSPQDAKMYQRVVVQSLEAHPSLPPLTFSACQACLQGLRVTLVGDSQTRKLFNEFIPHVLNEPFKAVKDERNRRLGIANSFPAAPTNNNASSRRLLTVGMHGLEDSAIDPWNSSRPLSDFRSFQCLSKGDAYDGAQPLTRRSGVVEDACVLQTGWPDGRTPLIHAALLQSDVLVYNFGHWQASNKNTKWAFMRVEHVHQWLTEQLQHWNNTYLTPSMHRQQSDRWDSTHRHLSNDTTDSSMPFRLQCFPLPASPLPASWRSVRLDR